MVKRIHLNDKQKKIFWAVFSMALAVFTIWMVYKRSEGLSVKDIIAAASGANKIWFGLAIIASALFIWFEGVAILSILKGAGYKKSRFQGLIYSTSDIYFSAITPSATGGQPASAYFMMRGRNTGRCCYRNTYPQSYDVHDFHSSSWNLCGHHSSGSILRIQ